MRTAATEEVRLVDVLTLELVRTPPPKIVHHARIGGEKAQAKANLGQMDLEQYQNLRNSSNLTTEILFSKKTIGEP